MYDGTLLRYILIAGVVFFLLAIIFFLRKKALSLKYTLLWLFSGFIMLLVSVFPDISFSILQKFGFQVVSNAIFSLVLLFILLILLSLTSIVSKQTEKIRVLTQVNALLEKRIRELEEIA